MINWLQLDFFIRLSKALDSADRVVQEVQVFFIVFYNLTGDHLAQETLDLLLVLNKALGYYLAELTK